MSRLLMCAPDYFQIDYEINPWMRCANGVDRARAFEQWRMLTTVLTRDLGAEVMYVPPVARLPDMVFTANAGVVVGRRVVVSRFRYPERRPEEAHFARWFVEQGYDVLPLDADGYFEGAGDLLGFPEVWFGGFGHRSDLSAYRRLSELFQKEIVPLKLTDPRFYHLDTCFCPLSGGELLYFPGAFDASGRAAIEARISVEHRFAVPEDEAVRFACNAVGVGRAVALPAGCPRTMAWLASRGYRAHAVCLDEFLKSGGAAKCLTLALPGD